MKSLRVWAYFLRLSLRSMLVDWRLSALSVLSVFLLSSLMFGAAFLFRGVEATFLRFGEQATVIAFLGADGAAKAREEVLGSSCRAPEVASCAERSATEARAAFVAENPDLAATVAAVGENPFLPSVHVKLRPSERPLDAVLKVSSALRAIPGVASVEDGQKWLLGWAQLLKFFREGFWILGAAIGAAVLFLFFAVISLVVHRRRTQMEVLGLVGATRFVVALPFVVQGFAYTALGSLLALFAADAVARRVGEAMVREFGATMLAPGRIAAAEGLGFCLAFALVGALGGWVAVKKCLAES